MANSTTERTKAVPAQNVSAMAVLAPAVGWLIPGGGHMIQKRWIRGGLLFISIVALFLLGLANDWGQGAIAFATADYGTKFMIVAGLLNFIAIADAYHIAIGKKK